MNNEYNVEIIFSKLIPFEFAGATSDSTGNGWRGRACSPVQAIMLALGSLRPEEFAVVEKVKVTEVK